jgi:hypothetical protein
MVWVSAKKAKQRQISARRKKTNFLYHHHLNTVLLYPFSSLQRTISRVILNRLLCFSLSRVLPSCARHVDASHSSPMLLFSIAHMIGSSLSVDSFGQHLRSFLLLSHRIHHSLVIQRACLGPSPLSALNNCRPPLCSSSPSQPLTYACPTKNGNHSQMRCPNNGDTANGAADVCRGVP